MIEILSLNDHVAAFDMTGTVTADDYDSVIGEIDKKLRAHKRIGIYVDMVGLDDITGGALAKDMRYGLGKLGELDRFPRNALVTDKAWIGAVVESVQPFFPQMKIRTFRESERDAAKAWVAEAL